jgi:hypothetical protein
MLLIELALAGALAVEPTPDTQVSALQISPVSTCDDMIIGVHNSGSQTVTLIPQVDGRYQQPLKVLAGDSTSTSFPVAKLTYVSLMTPSGVELGPWRWRSPADCADVAAPGAQDPGPRPEYHNPKQTAGWWLFVLGLGVLIVGTLGIMAEQIRTTVHTLRLYRRTGQHRPTSSGRHRPITRQRDGLTRLIVRRLRLRA